jgi:hypothetical protein
MAWAALASRERRRALQRTTAGPNHDEEHSAAELTRRLDATRDRLRREIAPGDTDPV